MTALSSAAPARLDIGQVVNRTFGAIGANFGPFFFLAVLFAALPTVLLGLGIGFLVPWIASSTGSSYALMAGILPLASLLVLAIPSYILVAALTQGAIVFYNGGRASFSECLGTGLRFVLPLVGLGIVTVLGLILWALPMVFGLTAFGAIVRATGVFGALGPLLVFPVMIILAVPAIIALLRWISAAPAMVVERLGVMEGFRRSIDLTRGTRWRIFWLALIYLIASSLIQGLFTFITTSLTGAATNSSSLTLAWIVYGATVLYSAINSMIAATGAAAIYFELRTIKEGVTSSDLAKVFE